MPCSDRVLTVGDEEPLATLARRACGRAITATAKARSLALVETRTCKYGTRLRKSRLMAARTCAAYLFSTDHQLATRCRIANLACKIVCRTSQLPLVARKSKYGRDNR